MHSNVLCSYYECYKTVQPILKDQPNYKRLELQFLAVALFYSVVLLCKNISQFPELSAPFDLFS